MKKCPKCKLEYFDNMLEFCLEDGARLSDISGVPGTTAPPYKPTPALESTVLATPPAAADTVAFGAKRNELNDQKTNAVSNISEEVPVRAVQILETAPIVISLAHNWWQWIYLETQYYSSFAAYVFSANFLMWLLLLVSGAAVSFYTLRSGSSRNKGFTYAALVILAVNLLLFIVPRR